MSTVGRLAAGFRRAYEPIPLAAHRNMGIRFVCPNGHKLNVKEFLAGRRGFCPFCGVSIEIPTESTQPASGHRSHKHAHKRADVKPTPAEPEVPNNAPKDRPGSEDVPGKRPAIAAAPPDDLLSVKPQPPLPERVATPPVPPTPPDPLDEVPDAVWYAQPETGGQYGPATAEMMRSWIAEGRIAAGTLVWREGWRDWCKASATFPQLAAVEEPTALPGPGHQQAPTEVWSLGPDAGSPAVQSPAVHHFRFRRRKKTTRARLIVILSIAVIGLLLAFVYILVRF